MDIIPISYPEITNIKYLYMISIVILFIP